MYLIIMSRTSFIVNPHPIVCLNVKERLARRRRHIWSSSDNNAIRTHSHLVCKRTRNHLATLAEWLSVRLRTRWLCLIIMSRTSFRVNPHSIVCLNVKERLAQSWRHIWSLSDSNVIRTHCHLVRKRTLNYLASLAKWLSVRLWSKWSCLRIVFLKLNFQHQHR